MKNTRRVTTLESKFPLMAVEDGYIISKDADLTATFRVDLPEIYTITAAEYEIIHAAWVKAINVLPDYSVIHKQDWYLEQKYKVDFEKEMTSLERSSELFFNERPFIHHECYLYVTKTTKQRSRMQSNFSTLCRGNIIPKEVNKESFIQFRECVEQFQKILNDSGFIRLERLTEEELIGTGQVVGLIEKYLSLSSKAAWLEDIELCADHVRVGDKTACLFTLSNLDDLPSHVSTDIADRKYTTDQSSCSLSFGANLGLLLGCNHIYNQYIFVDSSAEILRNLEKSARTMLSLSRYSRENQINREWIDLYLNEAHSKGFTAIRSSANVLAWAESDIKLKRIKNEIGSQITAMGCKPRHNTIDVATLFWAGIPGISGDFPAEESFYTFMEQAVCLFSNETSYNSSLSPFGIKMCDRDGSPLHIDLWDSPMKRGIISNRNMFVVGGSGSGKSFFMNHLVRQYWEQGVHIVLVDVGNSYKGLCDLINQKTEGRDGIYYTYSDEAPIAFNPFYVEDRKFDIEKKESIKALIMTLWKKDSEPATRSEEVVLSNAISEYINKIKKDETLLPSFNGFYEFVNTDYKAVLDRKNIREKDFDIFNFLNVLEPYYKGGNFDFLLNSTEKIDLLHKRFVVFEVDSIKDHPILFPVVTLIIMETFINKMRRLQGVKKMIVIEEAWKALMNRGMEEYIKYLYKTVRKFYGAVATVTQEIDDIISSPIVKESIINNSDCKILLDQKKYLNKFYSIQKLLGLSEKEKAQVLSVNMAKRPSQYKEVFIGLGGTISAVYATEVSDEEYLCYTTEETEKMQVHRLAQQLGGNIELAIKQLARERREAAK
ncbi:TraG family conjugative transposon ATPase [Butyricimonas virosa]|uniref:TraG family conjugative transposon ATPase n=1 Tax=Butyricimonas virosa TaxID=544645 RepID=UPI00242EE8D6|nr:TraG family conjugative transposon ATPase [Butyricimonas virosa]